MVYQVASVEDSGIPPGSVDLVVAAQAFHWFDLERFHAEVRRVAKLSHGVIAVWCYSLAEIAPALDRVIRRYYHDVVGKYWEPERRLVEQGYRGLPFPFEEIEPPRFSMEANWNLEHFVGYLTTWSATQAAARSLQRDPLDEIRAELHKAWGNENSIKTVRWPLSIRVGRIQPGKAN